MWEAEVELGVKVVGVVKDTTPAKLDETTEEVVDCTDIIRMGVNEPRDHILIVRLRQAELVKYLKNVYSDLLVLAKDPPASDVI